MRSPALALTALEVAVRGGCCTLARSELIRIHSQTHGTACSPPLGTCVLEDHVQPLRLRLQANPRRPGNHEHPYMISNMVSPDDAGGGAQIFDASIGTGPKKDRVDADVAHLLAGLERHVLQCLHRGR